MEITTVETVLGIAVAVLTLISILSGGVQDAWRRIRRHPTVLEEMRDELRRSADAAFEDLESRREERERQERASVEIQGWNSSQGGPGPGLILVNHGPGTARRLRGVRALADGKADRASMPVLPRDVIQNMNPWKKCERPKDAPTGVDGGYAIRVDWEDPNGDRQTTGWYRVTKDGQAQPIT